VEERSRALARYLFPRLQDVLFCSLLAVVILYGPHLFNQDGDLGMHIAAGRYILQNAQIPINDIFSHSTPGASLVPYQWLSQVFLALAYQLMGLDGDVLLTAIVIAATFLLAYLETVRRGASRLVGLVVVLAAAAASSVHWLALPHIFAFLLLAIWSYQLERFCNKPGRPFWIFPVIMLLWVNLYAAFIAGFLVLAAYIAGWLVELRQGLALRETGKKLGLIAITSMLVTFINPVGWHIWSAALRFLSDPDRFSRAAGYLPPNLHAPVTWPFLFLVGFALSALAWGKHLRMREALLLAGWSIMGFQSAGNIPLFAIVTAPIFGELLQPQAARLEWLVKLENGLGLLEKRLRGWFWPAFSVGAVLLLFTQHFPLDLMRSGNSFDPTFFPVDASTWLDQHPQPGKMFNYYAWGGYLLYRDWPGQKVFIDGQVDHDSETLGHEYEIAISAAPGWKHVLEEYDISWVIVPPSSDLVPALQEAGWEDLYQDSVAAILRKP
jgi:hypothetical protein